MKPNKKMALNGRRRRQGRPSRSSVVSVVDFQQKKKWMKRTDHHIQQLVSIRKQKRRRSSFTEFFFTGFLPCRFASHKRRRDPFGFHQQSKKNNGYRVLPSLSFGRQVCRVFWWFSWIDPVLLNIIGFSLVLFRFTRFFCRILPGFT